MGLLIVTVCTAAILKTYKARDMQFFLQNIQHEIFKFLKMFKYNMKFIRAAR